MFRICARLFRFVAAIARRPASRSNPGPATDWLPPVIGADDWRFIVMSDRSAGWYFDRR